tara:strand:- start:8662 stop:9186 length:525 start_codon:yes stop_codon:yes gene_type:complete
MDLSIYKVAYDATLVKKLWPTFKQSITDKHGTYGSVGTRGEEAAIKLIYNNVDGVNKIIDHSEDVVQQLIGIDLTIMGKRTWTVDVKGGRSGLYYNKYQKYWYITIKDNFWDLRKINTHIFHVGPKGDLYVMYNKKMMQNWITENKNMLISDTYGDILKINNLPSFAKTNLSVW